MSYRIENIAPILAVGDVSRSIAFYCDVLGFKNADWGDDAFTFVTHDNSGICLCKGAQGNPGAWIWIGFDGDIDLLHDKLKSAGVRIKLPPTNFTWAYEMQIEDPDGHVLRIGAEPDSGKPFQQGW